MTPQSDAADTFPPTGIAPSGRVARARGPVRRAEGGRLAWYRERADAAFWDDHWRDSIRPALYRGAARGDLGVLEPIFVRHLPREGRLLEAGCGTGFYVCALRARGYDCEGIEWAPETVRRIRQAVPDLPVRTGDVLHLDVPDGHYRGYISLGVVEHRREGPEPFLREASRVLADGGVMLVSVPHLHGLRRLKSAFGCYGGPTEGLEFYQYALAPGEMTSMLRAAGFLVEAVYGYDAWKGLKDEIPGVASMARMPWIGPRIEKALKTSPLIARGVGHMVLFACRKGVRS